MTDIEVLTKLENYNTYAEENFTPEEIELLMNLIRKDITEVD